VTDRPKKLAILVGGGPAPGINSVIGAATIRANLAGIEVVGVLDGFDWLMKGDVSHVIPLTIPHVSRIHFRGGSHLGISRANPTTDDALLETTVLSLLRLDVDKLITIGGDDTAFSAARIEQRAQGRIHVVHVPKTIDNDVALPAEVDTFGFQTARHIGAEIVKNLMVDAKTTHRWYFVVTMGRKAGHLALGIGKAAGATLTMIPEEFAGETVSIDHVVDLLAAAMIKRLASGRPDGVAVIAEGVAEKIREFDPTQSAEIERDAHGHIRIAEIDLAEILKLKVRARLKEFGVKGTIVGKNIGYELRCADPIPADMEYARDLGYCAARHVIDGGNADIVAMVHGRFMAIPFASVMDPRTGRTRVRMVDTDSDRYRIAWVYMIRLKRQDFEDAFELARYAAAANMSLDAFRARFAHLVADPRPSLAPSTQHEKR